MKCVVRKSGISRSHPHIASSPVGLVSEIIMEAKCPYSAKNRIINSTNVPYLKTSSDGKHLILD